MEKLKKILLKINQIIFLVFVACIPLTYFEWGSERSYTFVLPFFVSLLGFLPCLTYVLVFKKKLLFNKEILMLVFFLLYVFFNSVLSSFLIKKEVAIYYGVNPTIVALKESIYIMHAIALGFYSFVELKIASKKGIALSFFVGFSIFLFFGLIQLFFLCGATFLAKVINFFNFLKISRNSDYFLTYGRICASAPESAHMTQLIFCFFVPVSLMLLTSNPSKKTKIIIILFLSMLIPISLFAISTELIGTLTFVSAATVCWVLFSLAKKKKWVGFAIILIGFGLCLALFSLSTYFQKVVWNKLFGTNAYSAQKRLSHVYNAFIVFLKNPGFGVGSGMAGFSYNTIISDTWFMNSYEVRTLITGSQSGVPTAAPFFFYFLCSYGIFGTTLFGKAVYSAIASYYKNLTSKQIKVMILGLLSFAFIGLFTENIIANYYIGFLLSLPVAFSTKKHFQINYTVLKI